MQTFITYLPVPFTCKRGEDVPASKEHNKTKQLYQPEILHLGSMLMLMLQTPMHLGLCAKIALALIFLRGGSKQENKESLLDLLDNELPSCVNQGMRMNNFPSVSE